MVAGSVLWELLSTDLCENETKKIDALLSATTTGAPLANIKRICIDVGSTEPDPASLIQLFSALPRDQLRSYCVLDSRDSSYQPSHLSPIQLFETQTLLERLVLPTSGMPAPPHGVLQNNLRSLIKLQITPSSDPATLGNWLQSAPQLQELCLRDHSTSSVPEFWRAHNDACLMSLHTIRLQFLERLPSTPGQIGNMTRLASLKCLELNACKGLGAFLRALAQEYRDCGTASLQELIIFDTVPVTVSWMDDLELLLASMKGLTLLSVATYNAALPDMNSICHHGDTLRYLFIDCLVGQQKESSTGTPQHRYMANEYEDLVSMCPNIEELSVDISVPSMIVPPGDLHFTPTADVRFEIVLAGVTVSSWPLMINETITEIFTENPSTLEEASCFAPHALSTFTLSRHSRSFCLFRRG